MIHPKFAFPGFSECSDSREAAVIRVDYNKIIKHLPVLEDHINRSRSRNKKQHQESYYQKNRSR